MRENSLFWKYKNDKEYFMDPLESKFWYNTSKKECYFKKDRGIKYEGENVEQEMSEKKTRGRKPKTKPYFGQEQEEAVKEFLSLGGLVEDENTQDGYRWTGSTEDVVKRERIYRKSLKDPLNKMVESIIRKYKLF